LTVYLQEAAETFHKFYDRHRVLGTDEELTRARTALIDATQIILATGLWLLGVSAPETM
jgi:arginyl-tRNA synthetase